MFSNLFMYFGPTWSAVALFGVMILPFAFALAETLRLLQPATRRPCLPMIQVYRLRRRLVHSFAGAHGGNAQELRRAVLRVSTAVGRGARRR